MSFRIKESQSVLSKIDSWIKAIDIFGTPVALTYKKDPFIKSTIGGICTIVT